MTIDPNLDTLARTLVGEARGEGFLDMLAVACVVRERVLRPGWWSEPNHSYRDACRAPWQFSCWNKGDPNLPVMLHAEAQCPEAWRMARQVAELTIHCMRDRDVLQLFGVDEADRIPTHYYSAPLTEPPDAWGTDLEFVTPGWESALTFCVVYQGRPRRAVA